MKKLITYLVLICLSIILLSNEVVWQKGKPIRHGSNIEWSRSAITTSDNCVVYTWSDTRKGDRDVWAQKFNEAGEALWPAGGINVNSEIDRQEDPVVIDDNDGGAICAWIDYRSDGTGDVYAQKIDKDGNLLWNESGVPLCVNSHGQLSLNIANNANGGAYIIWIDSRNTGGSDIYGTHVLANGEIASGFAENGNPLVNASGAQKGHSFWEDGQGGAVCAWIDKRNSPDIDIYMQRLNNGGTVAFGENGKLLAENIGDKSSVKITPDGQGAFILVYRERNSDVNGNLRMQRVDLVGNLLWGAEGKVLYAGEGIQKNPRITKAADNGAFIVWEDGRDNPEKMDLYAQKVDIEGNLLWEASGQLLTNALNDQINPRLTSDNNGGCWFTFEDMHLEDTPFGDIFVQHFNSAGEALLTIGGEAVCQETGYQFSPLIRQTENNVLIAWGDNRTGSTGINLKKIAKDGAVPDEETEVHYGLSGDALEFQATSINGKPLVCWTDTRNSATTNQIYYQSLDKDGNIELAENGNPLTGDTGYDQENPKISVSVDNQAGIIWIENRGYPKAFMKIAGHGGFTALSNKNHSQSNVRISTDEACFYTGWTDNNNDFFSPVVNITGQMTNGDGELQWGDEGKVIADSDKNDLLRDLVGRYYIWEKEIFQNNDIYVKLVDEDGNTAENWPIEGLAVCTAEKIQNNPKGYQTSEGLLIIWEDKRFGDNDIYGQLISENGTIKWAENGIKLAGGTGDQLDPVTLQENNDFSFIWSDGFTGEKDIYLQKFDYNGSELYQENGVSVSLESSNQKNPTALTFEDKIAVFWEDDNNNDLYGRVFSSTDGSPVSERFLLSGALRSQKEPIAVKGENDFAYIFWKDSRSSGKTDIYSIYCQKFSFNGVGIKENKMPKTVHLKQNYPNPFNPVTNISFSLQKESEVKLTIYNAKGEMIQELLNSKLKEGDHQISFNAESFNSGVYFCSLQAGNIKQTKKMILLK